MAVALPAIAAVALAATLTLPAIASDPQRPRAQPVTCAQTSTTSPQRTPPSRGPNPPNATQRSTTEQLDQAIDALDDARALLASVASDPQPSAQQQRTAHTLRDAGITPALHRGWRQHATDTSDTLLHATDPEHTRAGRILARAGHGPTPADLAPPLSHRQH
ncbi:hypothetical protein [Pseudonocardia sp. ICBG601]|uniref:hypothetical protein n=1 Tax=Pseudonocardia sp. ICBG601 TaxID=2846759 RepID=UPI001CF68889|nr:hypothetical protein [Pseudonocardia sp. ICBG601]